MFLKGDYLNNLCQFLGVESGFIPNLIDANSNKVVKLDLVNKIRYKILRYGVKTKIILSHSLNKRLHSGRGTR